MIPKDLKKEMNRKPWESRNLKKYEGKDFFIPLYFGIAALLLFIGLWQKDCIRRSYEPQKVSLSIKARQGSGVTSFALQTSFSNYSPAGHRSNKIKGVKK